MKSSRRFVIAGWLAAGWLWAPAGLLAAGAAPGQTILPPPHPATQVSIVAKVPMAYAAAGAPGSLLIERTGSVLGDLTVFYQVGGKAVAGQDYRALKGARNIPAGQSKARITINPLRVAGGGGTVKGVRVTLLPGDGYAISAAAKASVKIVQ